MPAIVPTTIAQLPHAGSALSLWPSHNTLGHLNVVSGVRKITADILTVCLLRRGEDPVHPDMGLAPELFQRLSGYAPQYWVYNVQQEILRWVAGIDKLYVDVVDFEDYKNRLTTIIQFIPKFAPDAHVLTFGYYAYQGAIWNDGLEPFLDSLTLDGDRFKGF